MAKKKWEHAYPWGRALKLEAIDAPGGLKGQVDKIRDAVGDSIGTRNTFAKLFDLTAPPSDRGDALRARLLVEALGLDLVEWGVDRVPFPPAFDPDRVPVLVARDLRSHQSRWMPIYAGRVIVAAPVG
jgi:hypothetical protein